MYNFGPQITKDVKLNDSKIGQLNSERPLHQTAVCQVTAIMSLFVERPVASLWRRDAKAGVGGG